MFLTPLSALYIIELFEVISSFSYAGESSCWVLFRADLERGVWRRDLRTLIYLIAFSYPISLNCASSFSRFAYIYSCRFWT